MITVMLFPKCIRTTNTVCLIALFPIIINLFIKNFLTKFLFFFSVYPSLDASDDESLYDKKKLVKNGKGRPDDESWNPRARLGNLLPKTNRPTRDGAKRPAVERVLEAAAQRRALEPVCFIFKSSCRSISNRFPYSFTASKTSLHPSHEITTKCFRSSSTRSWFINSNKNCTFHSLYAHHCFRPTIAS